VYTNIISSAGYEFLNTWKSMVFIMQATDSSVANVMFVTSNNWDGYITETNHAATIGMVLYTVFNMWLLLASIILLLAMVGAIIITIK
jgi:NADH:ubiquinone oxidoreductase subunit 6 (subunit J)